MDRDGESILSGNEGLIVPVILSGGAGTRLWPLSRDELPKQFLPLIGGRSSFADTLERISDPKMFGAPVIVTGQQFGFLVAEELRKAAMQGEIVLEPMRRDSGPAVAVAAEIARRRSPRALVLVLAADHLVKDRPAFLQAVADGREAAEAGYIVTFGIEPDAPSSAYGYIERGEVLSGTANSVARFVEKPSPEQARDLVSKGFLWNSGNFLFRAEVFLDEFASFEPAMRQATAAALASAVEEKLPGQTFIALDRDAFASSPGKSVDYAVMEKTRRAAVVPVSCGWSDLGSWNALWEVATREEHSNALSGDVTVSGSTGCIVSSTGIHTAVVGVEGLAIIATPDAVLVGPRDIAAELKPLVATLAANPATEGLTKRHKRFTRDWGSEDVLLQSATLRVRHYRIKPQAVLTLAPGQSGSNHLLVAKGMADLETGATSQRLMEGHSASLPHTGTSRIRNAGDDWLDIIHSEALV